MSLLFMDSFGHYNTLASKWDAVQSGQIDLPSANARTNTGVMQIVGGTGGCSKLLNAHFTKLIIQVAVNADSPGVTQNPTVMQFQIAGVGYNIGVRLRGDGAVEVWRGAGDTAEVLLASSTNRPYIWNTMNSIECKCLFDASAGTVVLRVNGQVCINLSGIRTVAFAAAQYSNAFQLLGTGGSLWFEADCICIDWSSGTVTDFIAQGKVYVVTPFANGSPVNWIPLAGSNFSNVNEIPPDGDTSYNSSGNIGDVDQYQVTTTGVPSAAVIQALQHCMDLRVDSGARTVASVVGGTVGNSAALTTAYLIYSYAQDSIPAFPVGVGPKVTA